jgi:putative SOS response-associated peptidase YedK
VSKRPTGGHGFGIWQRWKGPVKKDGPNVDVDVYSFMTTMPNAFTASINHERMPVKP